MFKIRRKAKLSHSPSTPVPAQHHDPAVPRFVARQLLSLLLATHRACITMTQICTAMPPEDRVVFEHLFGWDLRPVLIETLLLIDRSEAVGLVTKHEAERLRAGLPIENPLPKQDDDTKQNRTEGVGG